MKMAASSVANEAWKRFPLNNNNNNNSSSSNNNNGPRHGDDGAEWVGLGAGWLRSLVGRNEWTVPCVDVKVRL